MSKLILGAIGGDIIGSVFEWNPHKSTDFKLFTNYSHFTDDTVMTLANMAWLVHRVNYHTNEGLINVMHWMGNRYPDAGYGGKFSVWITSKSKEPYYSYGNGSAMRCSPIGWMFDTIEDTLEYAKKSAEVTHNHPEGIKGAQSVAAAIFFARNGKDKQYIKKYIEDNFGYNLSRTVEEIRPKYKFDVTCRGSVPESIICFLESTSYESAVRLAVSLGGDSDTQAAIAGSIAEAFYGIPDEISNEIEKRLDSLQIEIIKKFSEMIFGKEKDLSVKVTVTQETSWKRALNAARRTIGKEPIDKEPSSNWKAKVLLAEHSPIKLVEYLISFKNLRQWVGVHLLRHDFTLPFIHSQREDRRELNCSRDELPQGTPNDQDFVVNAQTLINISRKRLCACASKETREAWQMVKDEIAKQDKVMADKMVPNCVYSGFCRELNCCGYVNTKKYKEELENYRKTNYEEKM